MLFVIHFAFVSKLKATNVIIALALAVAGNSLVAYPGSVVLVGSVSNNPLEQ